MKRLKRKFKVHSFFIPFLVLFILFLFLLFFFKRENSVFSFLENSLITVSDLLTPKVKIDYQDTIHLIGLEQEKEIQELQSLLKLEKDTNYTLVHASILSRNVDPYFSFVTIDKGKKDGLEKNMAVITENGFIGYLKTVFQNSSIVQLLTSREEIKKISVSIKNGESTTQGILTGYNAEKNYFFVTMIHSSSVVEKDNIVFTSGLGGSLPAGIILGTVQEIELDEDTATKILMVKSKVSFDNLRYVSVVRGTS